MDKSERVTGRRAMAQDCLFVLGDLLAEHALELRGRARARGRTRTYVRPTRRTYRYRCRTLAQPSHCLSASRSCQNRSLSFSRVCSCACRAGWPPGEGDLLTMLLSSGSLAPSVRFPETETSDWGCKRFAEACSTRNHDDSSSSSSRGPGCGWLSRLRRRDEARGRRGRAINVRGRLNVGVRWCSPCVHDTRLSAAQPRGARPLELTTYSTITAVAARRRQRAQQLATHHLLSAPSLVPGTHGGCFGPALGSGGGAHHAVPAGRSAAAASRSAQRVAVRVLAHAGGRPRAVAGAEPDDGRA